MILLKRIGIILLVLTAVVFTAGYLFLRISTPGYSGRVAVPGIGAPVEVHFDDFGVPHLYADDEEDAWFAFGYIHARERLFQISRSWMVI